MADPAFRHVASLAKEAGHGAVVEAVDMDEMEELREERVESVIMDSGLDPDEYMVGAPELAREAAKRSGNAREHGKRISLAIRHRLPVWI